MPFRKAFFLILASVHCPWLVLPVAAGYDFTGVFPPAEEWHAGGPPPDISDAYQTSGSSWWVRVPESDIFAFSLSSRSGTSGPFTVRIGKGGQIFSIRAYDEEWIPPQYRSNSAEYGRYYAPWVDEVFQTVAVNRTLNTDANPYFIHGAGIYLKDPPTTDAGPFYSPMLASSIDAEGGRLMIATWGQHPHVPTIHRSGLIQFQRITDRGEGIIEIEYLLHNAGEDLLDYFNVPWGGVRRTNLPIHYRYNTDGTRTELSGDWSDGNSVSITETAGFVSFARSRGETAPSLTIVIGNRDPSVLDGRWRKTNWRWGTAGTWPTDGTAEHRWRNYFVGATQIGINLQPGESLLARIFFVIGRESTTPALVEQHQLVSRAGVWKWRYSAEQAAIQPVFASATGIPIEPVLTGAPDQWPWFALASTPIPGWRPVIVLEGNDGNKMVADDFYRLAHPGGTPSTGFWRSYNGRTVAWRLLGFAPPHGQGMSQLGEFSTQPMGAMLQRSGIIAGDFKTELLAGVAPVAEAKLEIQAGLTGLTVQHRVPVGQRYSFEYSMNLVQWQPLSASQTGTNSLSIQPLESLPTGSGAATFFRLLTIP